MSNSDIDTESEAGFTLLEMVVTMGIFGALTIMVFNLLSTSMEVSKNAAQPVNDYIDAQPALDALSEAVRNSPDAQPTVEGDALFVLDQDNKYTVWRITEEGLTNGVRSFRGVREARFADVDGFTVVTMTAKSGFPTEVRLGSRFPETETMFTDSFMAVNKPADRPTN
ncbi:type II secretion system GspH family protein [Microbacterium enclense]|uniref:PulJ/GspJ family protein n=1 Tax=Microbacterium enclense TaxID=993073 RepID=UPI002042665B|nr:type II secretion system protein [Microbacterium enclense]MCM3615713.1 type II secretion system GspH family protein [Microbacterium enclense]